MQRMNRRSFDDLVEVVIPNLASRKPNPEGAKGVRGK